MVDLPGGLDEVQNPDLGGLAEFHDLLGGHEFREFVDEVANAFETGGHPGALWAKWIDVVVERTPPEVDRPKSTA